MLWVLFACVSAAYVERLESYFTRHHQSKTNSPAPFTSLLCYGFRYRDELGRIMFPMIHIPAVHGTNFTVTDEQCDMLLDFMIVEAHSVIANYIGITSCPGPRLAMYDMVAIMYSPRMLYLGKWVEMLTGRDWSTPMTEEEIEVFRNSRYCRVERPGACEDDLEQLHKLCPPLPTTPVDRSRPTLKSASQPPWQGHSYYR